MFQCDSPAENDEAPTLPTAVLFVAVVVEQIEAA